MTAFVFGQSSYTEVFRDDFNAPVLDRSAWRIVYGGPGTGDAFTWTGDNVAVGDGELRLTAARSQDGWTGGGISQGGPGATYGLFQVRAKADPGQGVGPALVLWPASNIWPGPETDLLESPQGDRSAAYFSLHWAGPDGSNQWTSTVYPLDVTQWHTYAVDWEPGELTYYIDGISLFHTDTNVPTEPLWVALQEQVAGADNSWYGGGPNSTTPDSVSLHVDWVSVSKLDVEVPRPPVSCCWDRCCSPLD